MRIRKIAVALLGLLMAGTCTAQINSSLPYRTLDPVKAPVSGVLGDTRKDRIEVIQFFYFGCPHCFDQQPLIDDWLAKIPADVEFRYLPALRDDKWITLTRAYFALAALGEEKRLRRPIYEVINFDGVMLGDEKVLIDRVARNGVDRARFAEAFNSEDTAARLALARKMTADYNIRATPTLVVGGKFLFSSGEAGSHHEAIRLLDQLVDTVRRERR